MNKQTNRSSRLAVTKKGREGKTPMVFLHGLACTKEQWKSQIAHYSKERIVLAIDLPGHGKSAKMPGGDYSTEAVTDAILEAVKARGIESFVLVGHAMGGNLAAVLAARFPDSVERLVLVDPVGDLRGIEPDEMAGIMAGLGPRTFAFTVRNWYAELLGRFPMDEQKKVYEDLSRTPRSVFMAYWDEARSYDTVLPLHAVAEKTLIVERDKPRDYHHYTTLIPAIETSTVRECGHWIHMECPKELHDAIDLFLAPRDGFNPMLVRSIEYQY